jgi:polyferredoxin
MECVNCTQCIDACNTVMQKIGRAPDLIRYSSQARDEGKSGKLLRARTLIYPLLITAIAAAFVTVFVATKSFDAVVIREVGIPHTLTEAGLVRNNLKLKITNRTDDEMAFMLQLDKPDGAEIELRETSFSIPPRENRTFHVSIVAPRDCFHVGRADAQMTVENRDGISRTKRLTLIGPYD